MTTKTNNLNNQICCLTTEFHPNQVRFQLKANYQNLLNISLSELDDVHNIINWNEIEQTLLNLYSSVRGTPSYPPLMMFKILILQAWYNLSDEALEKQIAKRFNVQAFY